VFRAVIVVGVIGCVALVGTGVEEGVKEAEKAPQDAPRESRATVCREVAQTSRQLRSDLKVVRREQTGLAPEAEMLESELRSGKAREAERDLRASRRDLDGYDRDAARFRRDLRHQEGVARREGCKR